MAAISMKDLEAAEAQFKLTPDGLTYQQRLARIAAAKRGETWSPKTSESPKRGTITSPGRRLSPIEAAKLHPLYGKRILITPRMASDKNRNLAYDEPVGHEIQVEEMSAGQLLYGASEDVDRMVGDYRIVKEDPTKTIMAKTTLPKIGQEISWAPATELVPVVLGVDGQRGYIWSFPQHMRQFGNTMIQFNGLKTLITTIAPELLPKFSGKPMMTYVDGLVLVASIPMTHAVLKEYKRKEQQDARLGLT